MIEFIEISQNILIAAHGWPVGENSRQKFEELFLSEYVFLFVFFGYHSFELFYFWVRSEVHSWFEIKN